MIDYMTKKNREIIRQSIREVEYFKIEQNRDVINDALQYFQRNGDHDLIRDAQKTRFAVGIEKTGVTEEDGEVLGFETYRKGAIETKIDSWLTETITGGLGGRIISSLANLFTAELQRFELLTESEDRNEDAEALLFEHRKVGGFLSAMSSADYISCGINSAFVYVDWRSEALKYQAISPAAIYTIYHREINDTGVTRGVDYTEIEDATAVVIMLADSIFAAPDQNQYLAIFGRSEQYPFGRHVIYRSARWDDIPDVGQEDATDYEINGQIANPLSWMAAQHPDRVIPEYPLLKIDGGILRITHQLAPTTTSLYENCLEVDLAIGQLLNSALDSAKGTRAITNEHGSPLPRSLEKYVSLARGQTLIFDGIDASNSEAAMNVLEGIIVNIGAGYNVPDYYLVRDDSLNAPSGVSLQIRTSPLVKFRNHRIQLNSPEVERIWQIEKTLIEAYTGDASLAELSQNWDPGQLLIPEDKTEKVNRLGSAMDKGLMDYVAAVREYHNLATDEEAMALIDSWNERATEYPAPNGKKRNGAQPVGLNRNQL